jgi:hypothetical protein
MLFPIVILGILAVSYVFNNKIQQYRQNQLSK